MNKPRVLGKGGRKRSLKKTGNKSNAHVPALVAFDSPSSIGLEAHDVILQTPYFGRTPGRIDEKAAISALGKRRFVHVGFRTVEFIPPFRLHSACLQQHMCTQNFYANGFDKYCPSIAAHSPPATTRDSIFTMATATGELPSASMCAWFLDTAMVCATC